MLTNFFGGKSMFTVRILNSKGDPLGGIRVRLSFHGLTRGITDPEYTTDSSGEAEFDGYDNGDVTVYVDGKDCGTEYYRDGDSVDIYL